MENHHLSGIIGVVNSVRQQRVQLALSRLLEKPAIQLQVRSQPYLRHVFEVNIANGLIPETGGGKQGTGIY